MPQTVSTLASMTWTYTHTHTMQELVFDHASASILSFTLLTLDPTHAGNPASRGNLPKNVGSRQ